MSKLNYTKLNLKKNSEVNTFTFAGCGIEVLKYLPAEDKYDLVTIVLQKASEDGVYNEVLLDAYFNLYLVIMYTNLVFTEKQREDELKLYDTLKMNGFFDEFFKTIETSEYEELQYYIDSTKENKMRYNTTAAALVKTLVNELPTRAESAAKLVEGFDKEKYASVVEFAKSVGNR